MHTSWLTPRRTLTVLATTAALALAATAALAAPARSTPPAARPAACAAGVCPKPGVLPRAASAYLLAANEAEPADMGKGFALINVSTDWTRLCYLVNVVGLTGDATAAHIHHGAARTPGPVVVPLTAPVGGVSAGCTAVDPMLAADIISHSGDYYVNVHTALAPGGDVRGQLSAAPLCTIGCVLPGA